MKPTRYVLQTTLLPYLDGSPHVLYQNGYASPHIARQPMDFLQTADGTVLQWSCRLPDLNPIEHDMMLRRLYTIMHRLRSS